MPAEKSLRTVLDDLLRPFSTVEVPLESIRARAEFLGVSRGQMHRIQRGLVPISAKMVRRFASRVGRTPDERDRADAELRPFATRPADDPVRRVRSCLEALRLQAQATLTIDFSRPPYDTML